MRRSYLSMWPVGRATTLAALAMTTVVVACSTDTILDVEAPEVIVPEAVAGAPGAQALRAGIIARVAGASSGGEGVWFFGGLMTDEWRGGDTFVQRNTTDQRVIAEDNTFLAGIYRGLQRVRVESRRAINMLRETQQPSANVGEMFALASYSVTLAGEHFCNGLTFGGFEGIEPVFGSPVSVDSAFGLASALADSGLTAAAGNAAARSLASVVKGRALLNRGQFTAAAAAVASVPTTFAYQIFHSANSSNNQIWALNQSARRYSVGDNEGRNGLPFRSANDPRVRAAPQGAAASFDNTTPFLAVLNYERFGPAALVTGIEARMIQAEAALRANDVAGWLGFLNRARTEGGIVGLAALTDPGTDAARVDLTFRERAFWFYGRGHRMGDMRRLIRQYGRSAETVFPTGSYLKGGNYGSMVVMPLPIEERNNPNYKGCTNLSA